MRRTTKAIMGTLAALVLGATLATAQSPDTSNTTIMTFSAPVSLPGVTLPAGSYMFKLADSQVNRNIVQVFDKDRSKILATILAIPAERNQPADETVITFAESPANAAPAIRYWYYPGDKRGQEFAYPKKQATEIANAAHTSVLSIDTEDSSADAMTKGKLSRVEPGAEASQSMAQGAQPSTPAQGAQPSTSPSTMSEPSTSQSSNASPATSPSAESQNAPQSPTQAPATEQPSASPSAQAAPAPSTTTPSTSMPSATPSSTQNAVGTSGSTSGRSSLPKTASTIPLVGLAGLLALASAFGVRALRRAHA
ncbi:MAG: hypothetical protein ACJ731_10930 [Vicinamibacterales bacterium]